MKKCLFFTLLAMLISTNLFAETIIPRLHKSIKGKEYVYTSEQIDILLKNSDSKIKRYPLFIVDLNTDVIGDSTETILSPYTAFELKATTNNFKTVGETIISYLNITNSSGEIVKTITNSCPNLIEEKSVLFWSGSEMNPSFPQWDNDGMRKYSCSKGGSNDGRAWTYYSSASELDDPCQAKIAVILDYTKMRHTTDKSWCNNLNENLTWSYVRMTTTQQETNSAGKVAWRIIQPVAWFSEIPAWAYTNNEVRVVSEADFYNK